MSGGYPAGLNDYTPGAPWNMGGSFECKACRCVCFESEIERRQHGRGCGADDIKPYPTTHHGIDNELCGVCEEYTTAACEWCGERQEQEHPERFTVCALCAALVCCDDIENNDDGRVGGCE